MRRAGVWLMMGVLVWDLASCSITCPDGNVCTDLSTCCKTPQGYGCCQYPNAVCCADEAHCCPAGYRCDLATQMCEKEGQLWMRKPSRKKAPPALPASPLQELNTNLVQEVSKSSVIHCDSYTVCPDGSTCCRHPTGVWFCCPYSLGRCCLDGIHCCPYGFNCDFTSTFCVRDGLTHPFSQRPALPSVPASLLAPPDEEASLQEVGQEVTGARGGARADQTPMAALTEASVSSGPNAVRCDSKFYCPDGTSCCKGSTAPWACCPHPLGQCCSDGLHCCPYGYTCDSSLTCRNQYSVLPAGPQGRVKTD